MSLDLLLLGGVAGLLLGTASTTAQLPHPCWIIFRQRTLWDKSLTRLSQRQVAAWEAQLARPGEAPVAAGPPPPPHRLTVELQALNRGTR